jgi:hypothetical protein
MVLSLAALLGCSGDGSKKRAEDPNGGGGPHQGDGSEGGGDDGDADILGQGDHAACLAAPQVDVLAALRKELTTPRSEGSAEIALSDDGCLRLARTQVGSKVTKLSVRKWLGYQMPVITGTPPDVEVSFAEAELVYVDLSTADDGSQQLTVDADGDGSVDLEISERYREERLLSRERVRRSGDAITARTLLTSSAPGTIHFKKEALRDGALVTLLDLDAPAAQNQVVNDLGCYTPAPRDAMGNLQNDTIACSDAQKQHFRDRVKQAVDKGIECLNSRSNELSIEQLELLLFGYRYADSLNIECFQANDYVGQMVLDQGEPKMRVNPEMEKCGNANFVDATLFHEVLHHIRGPHAGNDNDLGPEIGMDQLAYTYTDPFRSCEAMCFGGIVNTCSCAACFETTTCDSKCSDKPSCTVRNPNTDTYVMSAAVGALCEDPARPPATRKNKWFGTMMACESGCAFGAAQCKSYSLSCDDSCQ